MAQRRLVPLALLAARELGLKQVVLFAWHRARLQSGYLRRITPPEKNAVNLDDSVYFPRHNIIPLPSPKAISSLLGNLADVPISKAEEVVAGNVRLFGGDPVPLRLSPSSPLQHWTSYEGGNGQMDGVDIKILWEPARFGWAVSLARAYLLGQDERYSEAFWRLTETFLDANPVNMGPNWASGQEVALRLIALAFCWQVFHSSPHSTEERARRLGWTLSAHASRIGPTMVYARAQNNNHLLSEAAGLYTAGLVLEGHPNARQWREQGWKWFNSALQTQISGDGTYIQHSANYHRLMLQLALWVHSLGYSFPDETKQRLEAATHWLNILLDPLSGRVPNLGHNDGSYIFSLSNCPYEDYRPVIQACSLAFLGSRSLPLGQWDEMALWFGNISEGSSHSRTMPRNPQSDLAVLASDDRSFWIYFRAARFVGRPAHADQLHVDIWWRGLNLAQDPGTYLYNAGEPWQNALRSTLVHNTISVNSQDQMLPTGRFLWLEWAQAKILEVEIPAAGPTKRVMAYHDGYRRSGILHRRSVMQEIPGRCKVEDFLESITERPNPSLHSFHLHWLLPDWAWESSVSEDGESQFLIHSPYGWIELQVSLESSQAKKALKPSLEFSLVRAGERLFGEGPVEPFMGWYSSTYAQKQPALSLSFRWEANIPTAITSNWSFPVPD